MKNLGLPESAFHPKHHFEYRVGNSYSSTRGGEKFEPPPPGSIKLGLDVSRFNDGSDWLDRKSGWHLAYHGTNAQPDVLRSILRDGLRVRGGEKVARVGERYGTGIYVSPDPVVAGSYCDKPLPFDWGTPRRRLFHVVIQCRVRPGSYKRTPHKRISWLMHGKAEDLRVCGIVLLDSSSLKVQCRHSNTWRSCCGVDWIKELERLTKAGPGETKAKAKQTAFSEIADRACRISCRIETLGVEKWRAEVKVVGDKSAAAAETLGPVRADRASAETDAKVLERAYVDGGPEELMETRKDLMAGARKSALKT